MKAEPGIEVKGESSDPYETECLVCHRDLAVIFAQAEEDAASFWRCQHFSGAVCGECYQVGLETGCHILGFECQGCRRMSCAGCIDRYPELYETTSASCQNCRNFVTACQVNPDYDKAATMFPPDRR